MISVDFATGALVESFFQFFQEVSGSAKKVCFHSCFQMIAKVIKKCYDEEKGGMDHGKYINTVSCR